MRRKEFISGVVLAPLAAAAAVRAAGAGPGNDGTLLALAGTVIPDRDPAVWQNGEVAEAFLDGIGRLKAEEKTAVEAATDRLDTAAVNWAGRRFAALPVADRTALVKELLSDREDFAGAFAVVRSQAVNAFYGSRIGFERTGYRETAQFVGYPEYLERAETWE